MTSYEAALAQVLQLQPGAGDGKRLVQWVDTATKIGVSRTQTGHVELFIVGPELKANLKNVADHLKHGQYYRKEGAPFTASRLELPLAGHFDQVAAFICAELVRNGSDDDVAKAFAASEPVIDLALESLASSETWIRGLTSELAILDAMVTKVSPVNIPFILKSWAGHQPSLRDFNIGPVGVEVKATGRISSVHHVQGLHQVELQDGEERLFLVSFTGFAARTTPDATTVTPKMLVERISEHVVDAGLGQELVDRLVHQVSSYLPNVSGASDQLDRPFAWAAVRSYDMSDPQIQLLTSDAVAQYPNTVLSSLRFDVELPDQVTGDLNPVVGLNRAASQLILRAGLS